MQQLGSEELNIILSSSRFGMFGSAAASVGLSNEAWLIGPDCAADALRILAGPARQSYICSSSSSSSISSSKSAAFKGRQAARHSQSAISTQTPVQPLPQPIASAPPQDDRSCIGCKTIAAGRAMHQCTECSKWSCMAPCGGASVGPAAGGRPKRQGAGLRWSCPNPVCASPASHSGHVKLQQLLDAASEEDEPSDGPTAPQEAPSSPALAQPGPQQPSLPPQAPVPAPAAMSTPGLASVPQNIPAYIQGQPPDFAQLQNMATTGPYAYPLPMQNGPYWPWQYPPQPALSLWGAPTLPPMPPAHPSAKPGYPPALPGMLPQLPFMPPWLWPGYGPPMQWQGMPAWPSGITQVPAGTPAAAAAAAAAAGGGGQQAASRGKKTSSKKQRQTVLQEAANLSDEDEAAADSSDDDFLPQHSMRPQDQTAAGPVTKIIYKVRAGRHLPTLCRPLHHNGESLYRRPPSVWLM
jgi:hypothetical protein